MVGRYLATFLVLAILLCLVSGCNFRPPQEEITPESPATVAARTLEVVYTNVALKTEKPVEGSSQSPINPTKEYTPSIEGDEACINRALFVEDITIRDNMQIQGGESFNKIWRLRNDGTCIWNRSYTLTFFGGDRMEAPKTISLPELVRPGQFIDLSIDMTAPMAPGMHQGFWRLRSDTGEYFGIGSSGDQSFWVKIYVNVSLTVTLTTIVTTTIIPSEIPSSSETPTPTMSPTFTVSPTPIQAIFFQDTPQLTSGQAIDLDNGEISPSTGGDITLIELTEDSYAFRPQNNALLALYTGDEIPPTYGACEGTPKTSETIPLTELAVNSIFCYSTDEGRPGFMTLNTLDTVVNFTFLTWVP